MRGARAKDDGTVTRAVTAGRKGEWTSRIVNPPVERASTHLYPDCATLRDHATRNRDHEYFYGRRGSAAQWALCDALTELEHGAAGTVLYPSGVAAIAGALLAVLKAGDVLLMTDNVYDPSRSMAKGLLKRCGIQTRFFDPLDLASYEAAFCASTAAVLLENPGSLTMEVCDIPALARIAREKDAVSLIDNTWATSLGFPALEHGCDITIQSLTKHVGGHSDLLMGAATASANHYRALRLRAQQLGQVVSPDDAALALRGLRTMPLRLERSARSALQIARWLRERNDVAQVLCPMLPGSPGHGLWSRDFGGGCGLFSFTLKGDDDARCRFVDSLRLFGIGYSWGGYESLALPVDPVKHRSVMTTPADENTTVIRLSIGLEDPADLISDLACGFAAMELA